MELFHYTKVGTLELILKSKKLRFSSLDNVDDTEEKFTNDMYNFGRHCFVSCFTSRAKESLPIWEMYCKNENGEGGHGVRLRFNGDIFNEINIGYPVEDYWVTITGDGQPFKVLYTNDEDKIFPKVQKNIDGKLYLGVTELGIYKRQEWSFQEEWRYKLLVFRAENLNNKFAVALWSIPINSYDVNINEEVLKNLEVMVGYNVNNEERKKITNWINEFNEQNNANINIVNSFFTNKIK